MGGGRLLVAAQKDVRAALDLGALDGVEPMHFGALRGRNNAEDCAAAVIIGRPQPSCASLDLMAGALAALEGDAFSPAGDYVRRARARRMRDGSISSESVSVHPHPLGDALLRQIREAELSQAIDRLRLTRPAAPDAPRKRVYVLCALPLDMTVDEVVAWEDLQGTSRLQRAIHEARAAGRPGLRLSASGLAADAPQTFTTENAAKLWIKRGGLEPLKNEGSGPLKSLYRSLTPHSGPLSLARMRRAGERGSHATPVLVFAPPERAQGVLEAAFGPLLAFEPLAATPPAPIAAPREAKEPLQEIVDWDEGLLPEDWWSPHSPAPPPPALAPPPWSLSTGL